MDQLSYILDVITSHDKFIITAHETPDGDAIGSECALYFVLKKMGKRVHIFNADPIPHKYLFLDRDDAVETLTSEEQLPDDIEDYILLILDTNDVNNIGQVRDMVIPRTSGYAIIDHHTNSDPDAENVYSLEEASSTCEILYDIFSTLEVELDFPTAQALYVGIIYDTGSFIYPKTTSLTFRIAYELVLLGVSPNFVYSKIYESNSISSLVLQSKVLSTLELFFNQHVAVQTMMKETVIECEASYEEADTFINLPLKSEDIKVSIFFKQNLEGILRCSLRSKGNINVAEIAQSFGGGGHKTAAGFKCSDTQQNTQDVVLKKLEKYFT